MNSKLKSIILVTILALIASTASAQSSAVDKVAELDDVYSYYIPSFMIKEMSKFGNFDILKATPIPSGMLKKVKSIQFIMASKKKVVKKAQKILKDLDDTKKYSLLFRSSAKKEEKIAIYAYPAGRETFNEAILVVNEHDRQIIVLQLLGDFSMEDVNDIEEELRDDTPTPSESTVTVIEDDAI